MELIFRYEGMLAHSFDRFYVVTKVELPKVLGFESNNVSI